MNNSDIQARTKSFNDFLEIISALRSPDGCPWDKEQTPRSLREHLLEETYETVEAIGDDDPKHVQEELGDVLLLISMIAQIYSETGDFNFKDVLDEISAKLVRRHPHVFGDQQILDVDEVLKNWDKIKIDVEGRNQNDSVLDGIPGSFPPLEKSYKIQKKAAKQGFDWPDINGPKNKIFEEIEEIEEAVTKGCQNDIESEIGDLLFSVVNYSRHLGVDPTLALGRTNSKFEKRFRHVETKMNEDGIAMAPDNIEVMDRYWDSAKREMPS